MKFFEYLAAGLPVGGHGHSTPLQAVPHLAQLRAHPRRSLRHTAIAEPCGVKAGPSRAVAEPPAHT